MTSAHAVAAQARMELVLTLRRGESLVVMLAIPLLILVFFSRVGGLADSGSAIDFLAPGVIGLSVVAVSMVSFAISTAYDRAYGVLKLVGGSPLGRTGIILAKVIAVALIELVQLTVVATVAILLGWKPALAGVPQAVVIAAVGSAACTGLGLLMAGTLRAETTLALANLLFILFIPFSGVVVPLNDLPEVVAGISRLLPVTAFVEALRMALGGGVGLISVGFGILVVWTVVFFFAAVRTFRWE